MNGIPSGKINSSTLAVVGVGRLVSIKNWSIFAVYVNLPEGTSQETGKKMIGKLSQELGERTEFAWLPWWRHVCDIENGSSPMNSNQNP